MLASKDTLLSLATCLADILNTPAPETPLYRPQHPSGRDRWVWVVGTVWASLNDSTASDVRRERRGMGKAKRCR